MKALKILTIIFLVLLIAVAGFVFYLFSQANVEVVSITSSGQFMEEDGFAELVDAVENETFIGTLYQKPSSWKNAEDYVCLNYTVRLKNGCLVPIDRIELQVVPLSSDILQFGDLTLRSLNEKSEGEFSASILADQSSHAVREIIVSYYVWGVSFSLRTTVGLESKK